MEFTMHGPDIKRFYTEGAVKEIAHLDRKQPEEEKRIEAQMLRENYTPVLDITPLVGVHYDEVKGTYRYVITIYGVPAEEPWLVDGWLNGETIEAHDNVVLNKILRRTRNERPAKTESGFLRARPSASDA